MNQRIQGEALRCSTSRPTARRVAAVVPRAAASLETGDIRKDASLRGASLPESRALHAFAGVSGTLVVCRGYKTSNCIPNACEVSSGEESDCNQ
jgi:hypothetical protein